MPRILDRHSWRGSVLHWLEALERKKLDVARVSFKAYLTHQVRTGGSSGHLVSVAGLLQNDLK